MKIFHLCVWAYMGTSLVACGDKESDTTTETTDTAENVDNVDGSGCPSVVPEQYRYLWDCENAEGCSAKLYRHGYGESFEDGSFVVTEQWFSFAGPGDYCVDTFELTGSWDNREPGTFGCSQCEALYEIDWVMQDSQCEVIWSPLFADQDADDPATQSYYGFIMFDTHSAFKVRTEEMLVMSAPVNGNQYAPNTNYARGVATPTDPNASPFGEQDPDFDQMQPAEYVWSSAGDCLQ